MLEYVEGQWKFLLDMLPQDLDLEATARETRALVCPRVIRTAETLLRIVLAYCCCGLSLRETGTWAAIIRESLTIAGWVAMWRPMQIYLYDWWPLLRLGKVFQGLSHVPMEFVQKGT